MDNVIRTVLSEYRLLLEIRVLSSIDTTINFHTFRKRSIFAQLGEREAAQILLMIRATKRWGYGW